MKPPVAAAFAVVFCASSVFFAFASSAAFADEAPVKSDNRARAQELFDSALKDAESGDFTHACPKFLASQEADPKASTLLNLANCYEKNGQTASAWGAFREAEGLARKAQKADWESSARTRAEALEPKLLRLTISVSAESKVPGLVVTRDGSRLAPGEWGVAIPVDPGDHLISASADGYISIEKRLPVSEKETAFDLPTLEKLPAPPPEPIAPRPALPPGFGATHRVEKPRWSTMEIVGVATGGAGVVALAAGGLFALTAAGNYDEAKSHCNDAAVHGCPQNSVDTANKAYDLAGVATVTMITGAVLLAAGAALVLFSPSDTKLARSSRGLFTW